MKKIIIVILLSIALTTASIIYKQRQVEAIPPVIVYIAAVAAAVLIGKVIKNYFFDTVTQLPKQQTGTIISTGSNNSVQINWTSPVPPTASNYTTSSAFDGRVIFYANDGSGNNDPFNDFSSNSTVLFSTSSGFVPVVQDKGVNSMQNQILADPDYLQIGFYTEYEQFVGANSQKQVRGWRINDEQAFMSALAIDYLVNDEYVEFQSPADTDIKLLGKLEGETLTMWKSLADVPANCFDGIQNQNETGIDTGGVCPAPPAETCTDGIQNQGETGIDCGGPCLVCPPPPETCFDGIMNQNETGIDYGGVCGIGGAPPAPGPQPGTFIDQNQDGVDDISGLDVDGNVPVGLPASASSSTYDTSLPGQLSDVGETDWMSLIIGSLATNPLVVLASGNSINVSGAECNIDFEVYGHAMAFNFCELEWMIDYLGVFILAIITIRSVFIALGVD